MRTVYVIKDLQLNEFKDVKEWNNIDKEKLKKDFANHIKEMSDTDLSDYSHDEILNIYEYEIVNEDDYINSFKQKKTREGIDDNEHKPTN